MKRSGLESFGSDYDMYGNAPKYGARGRSAPTQVGMAMKLLVSEREANAILGRGAAGCYEIGNQTNTKLSLTDRNTVYPGTQLQELSIRGSESQQVIGALTLVMAKLSEETGRIMNDSREMPEGGASMKFIVPNAAAKAIIGRGGSNIKFIRDNTGLKVHVEETAIGPPPVSEQVVSLFGTISGIQAALPNLFEKMESEAANMSWFTTWAFTSHAGTDSNALVVPLGKGGKTRTSSKGGGRALDFASVGQQEVTVATPANMEMIAGALQSLPVHLALPGDWSQRITFNIPESSVSSLIGKAGVAIKEISGATGTKVQIREIEGNPSEKAVIIVGNAVGVISAYLYCLSRMHNAPHLGGGVLNFGGDGVHAAAAAFARAEEATKAISDIGVSREGYDPAVAAAMTSNFLL